MKSKPKIALFTYALYFGGTERVVSILANELVKYYDVTIILFYKQIDFFIDPNIKILSLSKENEKSKSSLVSKLNDYLSFFKSYKKALIKNKIDVSISFLALPNVINGYAKSHLPKLRTIISERCFPSKNYTGIIGKNLRKWAFKKYYNSNDILFSNSQNINIDLKKNFHVNMDTRVIYNPIVIDAEKDYSFLKKDSESMKIISVGRFTSVKNHEGIIRSLKKVNNQISLDIYGNGELEDYYKSIITTENLQNRVNLNKAVPNIKEVLKTCHGFVLNSHSEGFPNALLEAMSVGLPVIATNCMTGPLELLNENQKINIPQGEFHLAKYGILINVNDEMGLAKAIEFLYHNETERLKFSKLGFERAQDFDIEIIGNQIKQLIDTLL